MDFQHVEVARQDPAAPNVLEPHPAERAGRKKGRKGKERDAQCELEGEAAVSRVSRQVEESGYADAGYLVSLGEQVEDLREQLTQ